MDYSEETTDDILETSRAVVSELDDALVQLQGKPRCAAAVIGAIKTIKAFANIIVNDIQRKAVQNG